MLFLTATLTLALALYASAAQQKTQVFATTRYDINETTEEVLQVDSILHSTPGQVILDDAISKGSIEVLGPINGTTFKLDFACVDQNKALSFSDSRQWVACCPPGERPSGSPDTDFKCCRACESLVGSPEAGFNCCAQGLIYDGGSCKSPDPNPCTSPEIPLSGKCVCPHGMARSKVDKTCQKTSDPQKCLPSPSVQYGKTVAV
jgi:hypothetical protein